MNSHFFVKLICLIVALFLHSKNFGYPSLQANWMLLLICYWAVTNDKYTILPFFLSGLILDIFDSESLGFYSLYFVALGGVLSFFRIYFLNINLLKQVTIIFAANVSFLVYIDFMNLINNTPFIANEHWISVFVSVIVWLFIQLFVIPRYLNQSIHYEK